MRRPTVPTFELVATPEGDKGIALPKEWRDVVEDVLTCFDRGLLDNVPPSEYIQNIAKALYALATKPHRELTDVEIREIYSRESLCSYDAVRVMAGYRAIIAADRAIRAALTDKPETHPNSERTPSELLEPQPDRPELRQQSIDTDTLPKV